MVYGIVKMIMLLHVNWWCESTNRFKDKIDKFVSGWVFIQAKQATFLYTTRYDDQQEWTWESKIWYYKKGFPHSNKGKLLWFPSGHVWNGLPEITVMALSAKKIGSTLNGNFQ